MASAVSCILSLSCSTDDSSAESRRGRRLKTVTTFRVCRDHTQHAGGGLTPLQQAPLKVQIWGARRHIIWQVHQARQGGRQLTNAGTGRLL